MNTYQQLPKIKAIDLFCGAGGLTHGLVRSGVDVIAGYDIDPSVAFAYENNNPSTFYEKDVEDITTNELQEKLSSPYTLLAGCAPCQPFSQMNNGRLIRGKNWGMLYHFSSLVQRVLPTFVTMENVPQIAKHEVFKDFIDTLKSSGYNIFQKNVLCADYGVPQRRKRIVVLASRLGKIELIPPYYPPAQYKTVKDTIAKLPPLSAGQTDAKDPLHSASLVSKINLKRLKYSKPGGSWRDWPIELISPCHRKPGTSQFFSAYGRMSWDNIAPTITTGCHGISHGRFGHPEQDRALSFREAALLQSFPQEYNFFPSDKPLSKTCIARMIGNAVPVALGEAIGKTFLRHLEKYHEQI